MSHDFLHLLGELHLSALHDHEHGHHHAVHDHERHHEHVSHHHEDTATEESLPSLINFFLFVEVETTFKFINAVQQVVHLTYNKDFYNLDSPPTAPPPRVHC